MEKVNKIDSKNPLVIKGHKYDHFRVIQNIDIHAGFTALILYVFNGIRKAQELNQYPIIDLSKINTPHFYDESLGENIWNYYFEPINQFSFIDLISSNITPKLIYIPTAEEVMNAHHDEENRLATFWAWNEPKNKEAWMIKKRALGRSYVENYIQVKSTIKEKVAHFSKQFFRSNYIIGIHIRGTDFAYATAPSIQDYFRELDQLIKNKKAKEVQIFLATDQEQYVAEFKNKYKNQVITYNAIRSSNEIAPFRLKGVSNYKKGEDVLVDTLLLSECDFLLKGSAAVGEMALWFNPTLECLDFALESSFVSKKYHQLHSVFLEQNIGKHKSWKLKYFRFIETCFKILESNYILRPLFKIYLRIKRA